MAEEGKRDAERFLVKLKFLNNTSLSVHVSPSVRPPSCMLIFFHFFSFYFNDVKIIFVFAVVGVLVEHCRIEARNIQRDSKTISGHDGCPSPSASTRG
jgi:hypothetical protein